MHVQCMIPSQERTPRSKQNILVVSVRIRRAGYSQQSLTGHLYAFSRSRRFVPPPEQGGPAGAITTAAGRPTPTPACVPDTPAVVVVVVVVEAAPPEDADADAPTRIRWRGGPEPHFPRGV